MPQTPQQLKSDIDTGRTGDRIDAGYDPGLSPLGTDDEASGTPNTPEQVRMARNLEGRGVSQPAEQGAYPSRRNVPALWIMVAAVVLVLAAIGAALL